MDITKLNKEKEQLLKINQELENQKNQVLTRLIEIQGVLKYLNEKEKVEEKVEEQK